MIIDRLKIAYSPKKSSSCYRRKDLEFEGGDMVYLNISAIKVLIRFDLKGKLCHWYVCNGSERLPVSSN